MKMTAEEVLMFALLDWQQIFLESSLVLTHAAWFCNVDRDGHLHFGVYVFQNLRNSFISMCASSVNRRFLIILVLPQQPPDIITLPIHKNCYNIVMSHIEVCEDRLHVRARFADPGLPTWFGSPNNYITGSILEFISEIVVMQRPKVCLPKFGLIAFNILTESLEKRTCLGPFSFFRRE